MVNSNNNTGTALPLPLPLTSLNHISVVCRNLDASVHFYKNVLGFVPVRRPGSFNFDGAWLFNYGVGIHLLQSENPESMKKKTEINPKDDHISFQCDSMTAVENKLKEMEIKYVHRRVEEGGVYIDQLFFHDPDCFMIEICNCDNLPVIPLGVGESMGVCKMVQSFIEQQPIQQQQQQQAINVQRLVSNIHVKEDCCNISCA